MEDQFFDVCVQLSILGHLVEGTQKTQCFDMRNRLLNEDTFLPWTSNLSAKEVKHTAQLFLTHYGQDILQEVTISLPTAMRKLMASVDNMKRKNSLELAKLRHAATKEVFSSINVCMKELIEDQQAEIFELEWKALTQ
jgi:hypothetical protein